MEQQQPSTHSSLPTPLPTPCSSPIPVPVGVSVGPVVSPAAPLSSPHSDSLPFNSFHLAAEYNLYHLKAHLTSSIPLSSLPPRQYTHRYTRPTSIKGRSAPTSTCASDAEEEEDEQAGRGALFTSRAFHSSAAAPLTLDTASSHSSSLSSSLSAGVDGCCLHIPRWYYEDQLRQVVEQMERASIDNNNNNNNNNNSSTKHHRPSNQVVPLNPAAPTPHSSPATPATRTVSRTTTTIHLMQPQSGSMPLSHSHQRPTGTLQQAVNGADRRPSNKRVRVPTPVPHAAPAAASTRVSQPHQQTVLTKRLASTSEAEWEVELTKHEVGLLGHEGGEKGDDIQCAGVSVGMDLRRVKLLEMAKVQQKVDRPHSSPPLIATGHDTH